MASRDQRIADLEGRCAPLEARAKEAEDNLTELSRQLQHQNEVDLENIKLRNELRASNHAASEWSEQLAEMKKLVGASAKEKIMLSKALGSSRLPAVVQSHRVGIDEVLLSDLLGQGSFGQVHSASWRGSSVAVKTMHRSRINDHDLHTAVRSAELQLTLPQHPNVTRMLGIAWCIESARLMTVMELCAGGTLAALLQRSVDAGKQLGWSSHKLPIAAGIAAHRRTPGISASV